jgi:hypothetical protein
MYKTAGSGAGASGQGPGAGPDGAGAAPGAEKPKDNVVDAEFVDVDEKK